MSNQTTSAPTAVDPPQVAAEFERHLRDSYLEFETAFRREHPVLWWLTLTGPFVLSAVVLAVIYHVAGAHHTRRLLTMVAAALWFFGRFVILGGQDHDVAQYSGGMTSGELFLMVTYLDLMVALVLAFHIGYMCRLPIIGPRITALVADARFILNSQPWMKRAAFVGLIAFVTFPVQVTGSVGGSFFGRLLGMGRLTTFVGIVIGSIIGNGLMYLGSDLANRYIDKNHPLIKYSGIVVIVVAIVLLNWWYRKTKRRHTE